MDIEIIKKALRVYVEVKSVNAKYQCCSVMVFNAVKLGFLGLEKSNRRAKFLFATSTSSTCSRSGPNWWFGFKNILV